MRVSRVDRLAGDCHPVEELAPDAAAADARDDEGLARWRWPCLGPPFGDIAGVGHRAGELADLRKGLVETLKSGIGVDEDQVEVTVGRRDGKLFERFRIALLDKDVAQAADDLQRAIGRGSLRASRFEQRQDLAGEGQSAKREELDEEDLWCDPSQELVQHRPSLLFN